MSQARVHTQASNRAQKKKKRERPRESDESRKVVFKNTLDNPLIVKWPDVPVNVQNALLAALTRILEDSGISVFHEERELRSRRNKEKKGRSTTSNPSPSSGAGGTATGRAKRNAIEDGEPEAKKRKIDKHVSKSVSAARHDTPAVTRSLDVVPTIERGPLTPPEILSRFTFGINEVTKRLEVQTAEYRQSTPQSNATPKERKPSIRFIFACTQDVDPPSIIEHLPLLVASCNASRPQPLSENDIYLVPLPKNAEGSLTDAARLRRIAVLALGAGAPGLESLEQFTASLPILSAPWLVPAASRNSPSTGPQLIPTRIKQLRTTAPKDMRKAKEQRAQGRARAKALSRRST